MSAMSATERLRCAPEGAYARRGSFPVTSSGYVAGMNTTQTENTVIGTTVLENLLAAAGFDFSVVDRCPDPGCEICTDGELAAAA